MAEIEGTGDNAWQKDPDIEFQVEEALNRGETEFDISFNATFETPEGFSEVSIPRHIEADSVDEFWSDYFEELRDILDTFTAELEVSSDEVGITS